MGTLETCPTQSIGTAVAKNVRTPYLENYQMAVQSMPMSERMLERWRNRWLLNTQHKPEPARSSDRIRMPRPRLSERRPAHLVRS